VKFRVWKHEGKRLLENLSIEIKLILILHILRKWNRSVWTAVIWQGYGPGASSFEIDYEYSGCILCDYEENFFFSRGNMLY
jgi:hypothetical protein